MTWAEVPPRHRERIYHWQGELVRVECRCRWRSTLARTLRQAYDLWCIHIRTLPRRLPA